MGRQSTMKEVSLSCIWKKADLTQGLARLGGEDIDRANNHRAEKDVRIEAYRYENVCERSDTLFQVIYDYMEEIKNLVTVMEKECLSKT